MGHAKMICVRMQAFQAKLRCTWSRSRVPGAQLLLGPNYLDDLSKGHLVLGGDFHIGGRRGLTLCRATYMLAYHSVEALHHTLNT